MLSLQRAVPPPAAPAARLQGCYRAALASHRRRLAPCRVATTAAVNALQPAPAAEQTASDAIQLAEAHNQHAEAAQEPAVAHQAGAYNLLSNPLFSIGPMLPVAGAAAAVLAYTGVLFADNPLLRTAACGIGPICIYGIFPALDALIGPRLHKATEHGAHSYLAALQALCIMGVITCAWAAVASVPLQPLQFGLLAFTLGGLGTNLVAGSHEMIHSRNRAMKLLGEVGTAFVNFWGYSRGHHQHHKLLGTPEDHSTARKGENLWQFMARYLAGNVTASWELEAAECARKGKSNLHNRVFLGVAMQAAVTAAAFALGGPVALGLHLTISALSIFNMTVFDYVLHYGLQRDRASGEPVTRALSFNSHYPVENIVYMNGALHSHHHVAASRPYGDLETDPSEPTFPAPLNAWVMVALVPPLWQKVMDPLADAANTQHKQIVASMAMAGK